MKRLFINSLLLCLAVAPMGAIAQSKDPAENKRIIESKNFVFVPRMMQPQTGASRIIPNDDFDISVKPDSIISYLPYQGRAFTAPVNPTESALRFTSTAFTYKVLAQKKGRWEILIRPTDVPSQVQDMYFTLYDNGTATLRINSVNRAPISFTGDFVEGKEIKKKGF